MTRQIPVTPARPTVSCRDTPSPMLQPWEVYDRELFDLEMIRVCSAARGSGWATPRICRSPATTSRAASALSRCWSCAPHDGEVQRLPQQLPPPRVGPVVRSGRQLRLVDDLPVPQLGLRPRRPPDRHSRQRAHVSRTASSMARLRPRADPHRGGVGQARVRLPVAARRRRSREWIAPLAPTVTTATSSARFTRYHRDARPGVPDQLEGVRRELERRLPRAVRAPPAQHAAHARSTRSCGSTGRTCSGYKPHPDGVRHDRRPHRPRPRGARAATTPTSSTPTSRRCRIRRC